MGPTLGGTGLEAQVSEIEMVPSDTGVEFIGFAGVLQPLANLTSDPASFGTAVSPDVLFGGEATYWTSSSLGIGVLGAYAPANLSAIATQFQGAIPDELGTVDYVAAMLDITFRLRSSGSAGALEPYVSVGGGVRYLGLDAIAAPEATSSTDPAATAALGVRVAVSPRLWLRVELRDFASLYESPTTGSSRLQNDVGISLGLGIR